MPRTTPAAMAIAIASISVNESTRALSTPPRQIAKASALRRNRHFGAGEPDARVIDVRASGEEADELGERRGAESTPRNRIAQRGDQLAVVERSEQQVLVARSGPKLGAQPGNRWLEVRCRRFGHVLG